MDQSNHPTSQADAAWDARAPRLAVIATCFNRRALTLQALASLRKACTRLDYRVYLVDDGSTDGTGEAVSATFPEATVIAGTGSLYWNQGMRTAWQAAIPSGPDYYLWFNDDLSLFPGSLDALFAFHRQQVALHGERTITVGKTIDEQTGQVTYGGYRRSSRFSRLSFRPLLPGEDGCDTMNGNCVLIPAMAVEEVGIHAAQFRHGTGDIEYGLRAVKAGYHIAEANEPVGNTAFNAAALEKVSKLSLSNARFIFTHPKGLPIDEWYYMCRAHGGALWPLNFVLRYLKLFAQGLK